MKQEIRTDLHAFGTRFRVEGGTRAVKSVEKWLILRLRASILVLKKTV